MRVKDKNTALIVKLCVGAVYGPAIFAIPLFAVAGTLDWWRAWVVVGIVFVGGAGAVASLYRDHKGVLEERLKPVLQRGQPLADKLLVVLLLASFVGLLVFTPLDVFHLHLLPKPNPVVSFVGLLCFGVGWWFAYLAMRDNAFASVAVRHQTEREQRVVDTGVYRFVRHPMYAGGALLGIGMPLWLESYAGAIFAGLFVAVIMARIVFEERFLRNELAGYDDYAHRVRYRLIPFVW